MIAVISADIVASRTLQEQEKWLIPLKNLLATWGERPKDWELERGDFFQVELANPKEALRKAFEIKALIKQVAPADDSKKLSSIDIRMAIGIGEKNYTGESIKESNGPAFIYAGEKYDQLKRENLSLAIKSAHADFDDEMNLYLRLATLFMDRWSLSSAELVQIVLGNPHATQEEIGRQLGIKQNSVSGRWNRANIDELLELEKMYRKKLMPLLG